MTVMTTPTGCHMTTHLLFLYTMVNTMKNMDKTAARMVTTVKVMNSSSDVVMTC